MMQQLNEGKNMENIGNMENNTKDDSKEVIIRMTSGAFAKRLGKDGWSLSSITVQPCDWDDDSNDWHNKSTIIVKLKKK